ncbi:hypothetical protein NDA11_001570 [Ustilago hordei]|nr:hypothetical protein NDA11_001570 [Ustilago hordei]KAJ1597307.1 hypothetical protein NDA14_003612 [Ustilago hordei]
MSGFKSLTCLLFVALLSVTVQAGALIGHHSTLHRHMKRDDLKECTQDLASQTFKNNNHSSLRAVICYRTDNLFHVENKAKDHFQTAKLGTCSKKGWFGIRSSYVLQQQVMEDTIISP